MLPNRLTLWLSVACPALGHKWHMPLLKSDYPLHGERMKGKGGKKLNFSVCSLNAFGGCTIKSNVFIIQIFLCNFNIYHIVNITKRIEKGE